MTLWAHRVGLKIETGTSPYHLMYGHEAVLLFKVVAQSFWVVRQNEFDFVYYHTTMMVELDGLDWDQLEALDCIQVQKQRVVRAYNRRVKTCHFKQGDLL